MTTGLTVRWIHSSADRLSAVALAKVDASAGVVAASVASGPATATEVEAVLMKSRLVIMTRQSLPYFGRILSRSASVCRPWYNVRAIAFGYTARRGLWIG